MSTLPRIYPISEHVYRSSTTERPEAAKRPIWQRAVVNVVLIAAGLLTAIYIPGAVPWMGVLLGFAVIASVVLYARQQWRSSKSSQ